MLRSIETGGSSISDYVAPDGADEILHPSYHSSRAGHRLDTLGQALHDLFHDVHRQFVF